MQAGSIRNADRVLTGEGTNLVWDAAHPAPPLRHGQISQTCIAPLSPALGQRHAPDCDTADSECACAMSEMLVNERLAGAARRTAAGWIA